MDEGSVHDNENEAPADQSTSSLSGLGFPVVGLGASAGGIEALSRFLEHTPADIGMAFVVVLHLSPDHESSLDKIFGRTTRMSVVQVAQTVPIEPNHVYVISPAMHLQMVDGHLTVKDAGTPRKNHVAIDLFFRTLADAHQSQAIGILLSGTGSDGCVGMARVREQGGVTLAQSLDDAEFDAMPRNAIENDAVDFVLPVVDMPQKLLDIWQNATRIELPPAESLPPPSHPTSSTQKAQAAEAALQGTLKLLANRTGHDFRSYKRATVLRRIERRMQVTGVSDLPSYLVYFESNHSETRALLGDMLIGVTNFFRDREAFEQVEREVIPNVIEAARNYERHRIRVWTAGCSTGEEAYSIALLLAAESGRQKVDSKVQIFATDIDERAIATARRGLYPASIMTDVSPAHFREFFHKDGTHYRIAKHVRDTVLFAQHNILRDPPFLRMDLVTCRNLLIYLDRQAQRDILRIFHLALQPNGYLFLGTSETVDAAEGLFVPVDKKNRIYQASPSISSSKPPIVLEGRRVPVLAVSPDPTSETPADRVSFSRVHQRALEQYGPPTIIVDPSLNIVHTSGSAGRFLRHVAGAPSQNVLALVRSELRVGLHTAILQASKSARKTQTAWMHPSSVPDRQTRISATPFVDKYVDKKLILLVFEEDDATAASKTDRVPDDADVLSILEGQVQTLTQQLQYIGEHSDSSTEELKASNEELQAMNEELRSATEELETSKEELQSINEELITVNHELKTKVDETAKVNDDLQNLISSSDIATIFVDRDMRVKWFTPKTATLFNLIPADVGRPLTDITHRLQYSSLLGDAVEAFDSLRLIEREVCSLEGRWYLARILPYRTADDRIEGAVLNFLDITGRRESEQLLREGLARLRLLAESSLDYAMISTDIAGNITNWNRAAETMFGYTAAEIQGKPIDLIFTPEDREGGKPEDERRRARDEGHADDDRWYMRKNGSRFFWSGVMHQMIGGEVLGYAKIGRDMTDRRLQEEERQRSLESTLASSALKDEFIAVMSHELRHPLNLIQLNADLLTRSLGAAATRKSTKALEDIRHSVRSQSQIIEDLLDLSRIKTGKLRLDLRPIQFERVVETIVEAVASEAFENQITLRSDAGETDDGPIIVVGDTTRLEQVVWNLLTNAIKFTPTGGTVWVSMAPENGYVRLDIRDTGIGIATDELEKVFDMYGQVDRQRNGRKRSGLGIGLALVAQLVEAHNGRVSVTSDGEGSGSTFTVWLPMGGDAQASQQATGGDVGSSPSLDGMKVLLVDDSAEILEMLGELCEMEGAEVTTAADGVEALLSLAQFDFDVLVSDIGMPNMDGYELLVQLRASRRNADIPAIAVSGHADPSKALKAGYSEYLRKPVAMGDLIARLAALYKC